MDAGPEARRDAKAETNLIPANEALTASLGAYDVAVKRTIAEAQEANVVGRIRMKDASVWKTDSANQKIIANSMGWLTVASEMLEVADELTQFAETIRDGGRFKSVMVCGMGGSSLCPEVLRQTFGPQDGFPVLLVLDSTDPDAIRNLAAQIDLTECLFIIASKSGTTTEPLSFHKHWYHEVSQVSATPGEAFVAITDPGSLMAETAREQEFARIFLNQADIGGRYSALSYFGMVPAALMGLDVKRFLGRAARMAEACGADASPDQSPGAQLGAILAECALAGRDKLTITTDDKLAAVGLWVEQLIAESTGKEGHGIVPIVNEAIRPASTYGQDRLFVSMSVGALDDEAKAQFKALEDAGHPVVYRTFADLYDLGAEFFIWEFATAFAAWRMAINPFDQPNVQESKDATRALLEVFNEAGKLPAQSAVASDETLTVYADDEVRASTVALSTVAEVVHRHLDRTRQGDYVALLAYVEETPEIEAAIQLLREKLRTLTRCATTTGYGPRFLHSTRQLHKGGPDTGVFMQLTAPDKTDMPVPGETYSFSVLRDAQAQGDFESLLAHGRRAIRVDLGTDVLKGLHKLSELIERKTDD